MRVLKLCVVLAVLAPVVEAQIRVRPGQYEYTMDMNLGGRDGKPAVDAVFGAAGGKTDDSKSRMLQCVTAADVKDMQDPNSLIKVFAAEIEDDGTCKVSNAKIAGNTLSYTATCVDDGTRTTMTTEMTFSGDTMTGVMKGQMDGQPLSSSFSARRVGDCPK